MTSLDPPAPLANLLIVDDAPDTLRLLSKLLTQQGYRVRRVINGQLAIDAAQLDPPDLVLLDIMMPVMNGFEVCKRLKAHPRTRTIPVIFLSALDEELDKVQAFQVGGVDYVTKPFQVMEVLARIETHLSLSRLKRQIEAKQQALDAAEQQRQALVQQLEDLRATAATAVSSQTAALQTANDRLLREQSDFKARLSAASQLNQERSDLMITATRAVRSPLSVIITAIELLKRELPALSAHHRTYFDRIANSVQQVRQVLQDALTLLDADPAPLQYSPLDLPQFCAKLLEQWQAQCPAHHFNLTLLTLPTGPLWVDPALLQQIFTHLLTNAVRYSPAGGTIELQLEYDTDRVTFSLQDEGIGIPLEEQAQIFERFYRASNATILAGEAGAGLGLVVVKSAIERHGGQITVTSQLGQGSTFTVTLPLQRDRSGAPPLPVRFERLQNSLE